MFFQHGLIRSQLYDYARGTLDATARPAVEGHLLRCTPCSSEVAELRQILSLIPPGSYQPADRQPEMYWQMFVDRAERRLEQAPVRMNPPPLAGRVGEFLAGHRTGFVVGFGSAMVVMVMAVMVFRFWQFSSGPVDPSTVESVPEVATPRIQTVSAEERAYEYLDRSKVLLLGIVNSGPAPAPSSPTAWSRNRQVSRTLLAESKELSQDLQDPSHSQLRRLLSDLEVILVQIANLEATYDSPAIDVVRSSVDRQGILLKINLEKLQRADQRAQGPDHRADAHGRQSS